MKIVLSHSPLFILVVWITRTSLLFTEVDSLCLVWLHLRTLAFAVCFSRSMAAQLGGACMIHYQFVANSAVCMSYSVAEVREKCRILVTNYIFSSWKLAPVYCEWGVLDRLQSAYQKTDRYLLRTVNKIVLFYFFRAGSRYIPLH